MPRQFYLAKSCVHLFFLFFFFLLAVCKSGWWTFRCIWVVGIALTASLWPHWSFYFWLQCYVLRLIWTFFFFFLFLLFFLILSSSLNLYPRTLWVDFVACGTWYLNLSLIWILEWQKKKKRKKNILFIINILTLVKKKNEQTTNICFFLKNHKQCIYDRFHINFWKTKSI